MREHWPKVVIVGLVLLIVGVPLVMRDGGAGGAVLVEAGADRLVIYTPHNEQIRFEFEAGFNRARQAAGEPMVDIDWRSSGGTGDLRKQIVSQYEAVVRGAADAEEAGRLIDQRGIGADLFFGGGEYEHNALTYTVKVGGLPVPVTRPAVLPEGLQSAAFPTPTISGERLYHPDMRWVGATLASFGIVYNKDVLRMLDLPTPTTWEDLADPRYFGEVALSDPGHSGSIAATYETIIKRLGWHEGWAVLRRTFANARYFTGSSAKVPVDVSQGEAAAGMCIDFYGRFQSGAIANADGTSRVGYVDPLGMTATTADPISLLRGGPNPELADEFVAWLLSLDAQRLWQYEKQAEGGPLKFELRRQPIRRDSYADPERVHFTDKEIDPFGQAEPVPAGTPRYYDFIAPIAHAMAIDLHDHLKAAWSAINRVGPTHPNHAEMLMLFDAMPPELTIHWPDEELERDWRGIMRLNEHPRRAEVVQTLGGFVTRLSTRWKDRDQRLADRLAWTKFFRKNYRRIVALSREKTS